MRVAQGTYDGTPESAAVVERFDLPDNLPEPVAVAKANFDRCVEHLREAKQARSQAQEELVAAARADVETEAQALVTGAAPPKKKAEENARAAAEDASRAEAVAVSAVDQAGDALLEAIEEARPEWLGQLDQEAAAAHSRFTEALSEVGAALDALSWALAPRLWLDGFDTGRARIGGTGGVESLRYRPDLPKQVAEAFTALATLGAAARATRQTVHA